MIVKLYRLFSILSMTGFAAAASACSHSGAPAALPPVGSAAQRSAQHVTIEEFRDLPRGYGGGYFPTALTTAGNALWVADDIDQDLGRSAVARIGITGTRSRTFYYQNNASPSFEGVVEGADGALWLTDTIDGVIVRVTMQGKLTTYSLSVIGYPQGIVAAPDGALWFTGSVFPGSGAIGRITTGGVITSYTKGFARKYPRCITVGSDGALWFTENGHNIGRISLQGKVTQYSKGISARSQPYSIAPGPDGALWFTELNGGRIGRITTDGTVAEYSSGITSGEQPNGIAPGPDNAMWFTESKKRGSNHYYDAMVGRITMSGKIVEYEVPTNTSEPTAIVAGPDGNMWFVETNANRVGRVTL